MGNIPNAKLAAAMNSLLPRLINTRENPRIRAIPEIWQRAVYKHGQLYPPGLSGGMPAWLYAEFDLQAQAADDTTIPVPVGFHLLSFSGFGYEVLTPGNPALFRLQIYDVNGQRDFIPGKAVNGELVSGNRGRVAFLTEPYFFAGDEPQAQIRVSNRNAAEVIVQVALYGIQGVPS